MGVECQRFIKRLGETFVQKKGEPYNHYMAKNNVVFWTFSARVCEGLKNTFFKIMDDNVDFLLNVAMSGVF